jgi:asparagine synthetase B (glutamine-hydrolysing)
VVELIRGGAIGTTVHSYSSTYPSDPQNDEEPFARSVVAMYPELRASFQSQEGQWAFQEFRDGRDYPLDEPELVINRTVMMWRLLQARRDGCEVVLTGGFADQLLTGWYVPSMMADLGWRALRRELPRFAQGRSALVTVLGGYARRIAWRLPPFRERRRRRLSAELPAPELPNEASFSAYANLTHGGASVSLAQMVHAARMAGVGFAFPYLDRDLVEFCLHLPIHLRFQGGIRKFIVRQAFAGRLPPGVLERQWGTSLWPASRTGVARERALIESMLTGTRLVSLGFLSAREVSGLLPAFDATPEPRAFQRLYRAISVETWLRRITAWPW